MIGSPLETPIAFHLGPVPIATPVLVTWGIMILLAGGSWMLTRRLELMPGRMQAVLELVVEAIDSQIRETMRVEPARFRALIGTLLVFVPQAFQGTFEVDPFGQVLFELQLGVPQPLPALAEVFIQSLPAQYRQLCPILAFGGLQFLVSLSRGGLAL